MAFALTDATSRGFDAFEPVYRGQPVPEAGPADPANVSQVGFMLHDRLLRPAQVGVSSTPAKATT